MQYPDGHSHTEPRNTLYLLQLLTTLHSTSPLAPCPAGPSTALWHYRLLFHFSKRCFLLSFIGAPCIPPGRSDGFLILKTICTVILDNTNQSTKMQADGNSCLTQALTAILLPKTHLRSFPVVCDKNRWDQLGLSGWDETDEVSEEGGVIYPCGVIVSKTEDRGEIARVAFREGEGTEVNCVWLDPGEVQWGFR